VNIEQRNIVPSAVIGFVMPIPAVVIAGGGFAFSRVLCFLALSISLAVAGFLMLVNYLANFTGRGF